MDCHSERSGESVLSQDNGSKNRLPAAVGMTTFPGLALPGSRLRSPATQARGKPQSSTRSPGSAGGSTGPAQMSRHMWYMTPNITT